MSCVHHVYAMFVPCVQPSSPDSTRAKNRVVVASEAEELCKKLEDEADPTKLLERTEERSKWVALVKMIGKP